MSSELFPLIAFLIIAPILWYYFQNKKKNELNELTQSAIAAGLIDVSDPKTNQKVLENMQAFNLFASGTNKTITGRFKGERNSKGFEVFGYSHGQMASNSVPQKYLVFSQQVNSRLLNFSIISKDTLHRWRKAKAEGRREVELSQASLSSYRLYIHDVTGPTPDSNFINQFSSFVSKAPWQRAEVIDGQFIYYISIKDGVTPERIEKLINEALELQRYL